MRYEERGQGYRDVEKVGKHWARVHCLYVTKKIDNVMDSLWLKWQFEPKISERVRTVIDKIAAFYAAIEQISN